MNDDGHTQSFGQRFQARLELLVIRPIFWVGLVTVIGSYPVIHSLTHPLPEPIPILSKVEKFEFLDEKGKAYGFNNLWGQMWVASRICTSCTDVDPDFMKRLFKIQHHSRGVGKRFRLVSFSVDPADTPEKLLAHAKAYRYSPRMWSLLTGPQEEMKKTLDNIFEPAPVVHRAPDSGHELDDGSKVALIDVDMNIRRYYDVSSKEGFTLLLRDMGLIVNRGY
jgi:cytochrome oxidase Cu insertion factor (SCO1/SenC/PrrC family)